MGVVVDFIGYVLGRSNRRRPRRMQIYGVPYATPVAVFDEGAYREALARLDRAPASEVVAFGAKLAASCLSYGDERRKVAHVAMQAFPEAAWVLSFDRDGYVREAALRRLKSRACSPGRFVAVALRLNDWVPQVRAEAVVAAGLVWPSTPVEVVAEAAPYLLRQRFAWGRWRDEALCVDELLSRPEVAKAVVWLLLQGQHGGLGRILSQALRFPAYDLELARLATEARLPDVRAVAAKTLLTGKVVWPVGYEWVWTDKSLGERRRAAKTESRSISVPAPPGLVEAALKDRSVLVRKVAADYVIDHRAELPGIVEIAARLAGDKSAAVRDRADYIRRHLQAPADGARV